MSLDSAMVEQMERLSHHSEEVCTSLLTVAFQSLGSHDASSDTKIPSGIPDAAAFVTILTHIISQSIRQNLTAEEFVQRLRTLNVRMDVKVVREKFAEAKAAVEPLIRLISCNNASFPLIQDIEWRIELEVHRKNLRNVCSPVVLMAFVCEGREKRVVRMRVSDVFHMRQVLEEALTQAKSQKVERQVRKCL